MTAATEAGHDDVAKYLEAFDATNMADTRTRRITEE